MEKDQIIILENRGLVSITGHDAQDYLQNIITSYINKVSEISSIFAALLSPQGKYLFEFFVLKSEEGYFLDCDSGSVSELISHLSKYKIGSKVEIKNLSSNYAVGIISLENFKIIQNKVGKYDLTLKFRTSPIFVDPRDRGLGARIISPLENLYLTIKKLNLKITAKEKYLEQAYFSGIPVEGLKNLQNQLFGLELNFERLNAIDFKKGCYVGQENTARMKLKKKIRRKLMPVKTECEIKIGDEIKYNDCIIGKILIDKPFPFAVIKLFDPEFSLFKNEKLIINEEDITILS